MREGAMLKEFKDFINRGNVIDLAVAVVLGVQFGAIVTTFVDAVLLPIIGLVFGEQNFGGILDFEVNGTVIGLGTLVDSIVQFVLIALGVFIVVKVVNKMKKPAEAAPAAPTEIELLTEIRDALRSR
jgi:large conductance mechanosensitive channel